MFPMNNETIGSILKDNQIELRKFSYAYQLVIFH